MVALIIAFWIAAKASTVEISIDASAERKPISPYIFGKNNSLSDNPQRPLSQTDWQFLRDAGVRMFRENGGNNSTKYNWRLKLSSHPDWYNNVYSQYWNMDNEPDIWSGTHDDVFQTQPSTEAFMQIYFDVAKKARALFPEIKLVGPVATNEWQWYNWDDKKIDADGKSYTWCEYFIKRIGEEQQANGIRLLDVLDLHFYPVETDPADIVQVHRVWFDMTYDYPGANGVKRSGPGSWDNSITREYIFERCRVWLEQYLGPEHGVSFGVSEMGIRGDNPNVTAVWYASNLGVFADEGVELFTPWTWKTGMWEVLHLFSRYFRGTRVASFSDSDNSVSAYSSINSSSDSLTIILVNRTMDRSEDVTVTLSKFTATDGEYAYLMLDDLPDDETFKSHTDNALKEGTVTVNGGSFPLTLPPLSVTAVLLSGKGDVSPVAQVPRISHFNLDVYPNPFNPITTISYQIPKPMKTKIELFDISGRYIQTLQELPRQSGSHTCRLDGSNLSSGVYFIRLLAGSRIMQKKIALIK